MAHFWALSIENKADYKNAEKLAENLTKNFPNHELSWKILSISYKKFGKTVLVFFGGLIITAGFAHYL